MATYRFVFGSDRENEGPMLDQLQELLHKHGVDNDCRHRLLQAVSEAFTNALLHGNQLHPDKKVRLGLQINEQWVRADISDDGEGALERIATRSRPPEWSENGRGIDLIRHYADEARFLESPSGGLTVEITVYRQPVTMNVHMK